MSRKRSGYRLLALLVWTYALAAGADWLSQRGDPQQTGWQKDEKTLTVSTVKQLRLLWKRKLSDSMDGLTDPIILGPVITHRGIKELVFVKDSSDTVYAVDADLGTTFWSRKLKEDVSETATARPVCAKDPLIAPVMSASIEKPKDPAVEDDDNFSDPNRPLYVLSADRRLYALRPSTGGDFLPPVPFVPPSVRPVSLKIDRDTLYATTASVCGGFPDHLWTLNLKTRSTPQSQPWQNSNQALTVFPWKGRDLFTGLTSSEKPVFLHADNDRLTFQGIMPESARSGGLASWQDAEGTRWIDITSTAGVKAFQVTGSKDQPVAMPSWTLGNLIAAGPPVVTNSILFFLSTAIRGERNHLVLRALDALTGKELYASGDLITSHSSSGNIAIANGHVCFSTEDGILYCFGLPFEM